VTADGGPDTTALAAAASGLEIDWLLSSSRAGMSHDPFKREQMLVHRKGMHDNIMQLLCLLRVLFLRRILSQMDGVPATFSIKTKHSKDYNIIHVISRQTTTHVFKVAS
jgi:hypothetical protein